MKTQLTKIVNGQKLVAHAGLSTTNHTYFSCTIDIYEKQRGRWVDVGGGADHETILEYFPVLMPIVNLHLSNENGVPMYAIENGFYEYQQYKGIAPYMSEEDKANTFKFFDVLCKHLRIDASVCQNLIDTLDNTTGMASKKVAFAEFVTSMLPIWLNEANEAKELLKQLIAKETQTA